MIYFVQAAIGGPVKIGYAQDPEQRLRDLQCGSPFPLRLLRSMPGSLRDERALHTRFASERLHGEWFEPSPRLRALVVNVGLEAPPETIYLAPPVAGAIAPSGTVPHYGPLLRRRQVIVDALQEHDWVSITRLRAVGLDLSPSAVAHSCRWLCQRGWVSRRVAMQSYNGAEISRVIEWRLNDGMRRTLPHNAKYLRSLGLAA